MTKLNYQALLISFSLLINSSGFAESDSFPLPPRLLGDGTTGTTTGARGDLMVPLLGSEHGIIYGDVQGKYYRDDSWFGGIAGGFRQAFGRNILGGYLFADRSESTSHKYFWSLNPGIEAIYAQWDGHLNGYFPVGSRSKTFRSAWADDLGDYRFVSFSGHKQFDHILVDTETAGRGVDAEVGYRVQSFNNLRLALGGYYFNFHDMKEMRGIIGTIEYPFTDRISVLAQDSYDNLHNNTFMFTVRLRFGAINPTEGRLLEPIRRNLSTLDSGTAIPTERGWVDNGANLVEKDHIWFFKPGGEIFNAAEGLNNCTAEKPCTNTEITQSEIDTISALDPIDTLDLATGYYLLDTSATERIRLNPGQSIDGRTFDFKKPAFGNERPMGVGGIDAFGSNISNIILVNQIGYSAFAFSQEMYIPQITTSQRVGMRLNGNNSLVNSTIGTPNDLNGYSTGVRVDNATSALIIGSEINAGGVNVPVRGVDSRNAVLDIRNSIINVRAHTPGDNSRTTGIGAELTQRSKFTSQNVNYNVSVTSPGRGLLVAEGIGARDQSTMNVIGNIFNVSALSPGNGDPTAAIGIINATFARSGVESFSQVIGNLFLLTATGGNARVDRILSNSGAIALIENENYFLFPQKN